MAVLAALFATAFLFAGLWFVFPERRPFLVAVGAALGTLFAALAGFSDNLKGKLVPAVLASILVGLGTWFTAFDLDRENKSLEKRLGFMREAFLGYARGLTEGQKATLVSKLAKDDLRKRVNDGESAHVADMSDFMLQLNPENGYGLYFAGEAWRLQRKREQMRGEFTKYLSLESQLSTEERYASVAECYQRADGFCAERTAWIGHMMANDFYQSASDSRQAAARISALESACGYIKDSLDHFPRGFDASTSFSATRDLQGRVRHELAELKGPAATTGTAEPACEPKPRDISLK